MANIGVYIELKEDKLKKSNREVLGFARRSGRDVTAVIFTNNIVPFLEDLKGIKQVIQVKGDDLAYQPDIYADTLAAVIKEFKLEDFLAIYSAQARDLFPRVTVRVGNASLVNDCLAIDLDNHQATRPVYAGKLLCNYKIEDEFRIFTIRRISSRSSRPGQPGIPRCRRITWSKKR